MIQSLQRVNYRQYLNSPAWEAKRRQALERAGQRCQTCGRRRDLEVHHNTYSNLGDEKPEDLVVLCLYCHRLFKFRMPAPPEGRSS